MAQPYHNSNCFHELNHIEDQHHYHLFNYKPDHQTSSSLSCPVFVNDHIDQVQRESYFREPPPPQHFQFQLQADHQMVPCGGSCDLLSSTAPHENQISDHHDSLKLNIWKSSDHELEITNDDTRENMMNSTKWMSSKMRIMKKMMNGPDQTNSDMPVNYTHKQYPTLPLAAYQSNNSSSTTTTNINKNNTTPIRVCSDCNTTKTPLWRSGPRGPKSLCNACGIRQRKARRAMAAAASGTILEVNKPSKKGRSSSVQKKEKKPKNNNNNNTSCLPFKKRCKLNSPSRGRKKKQIGSNFEELSIRISKNISAYQLSVFPQDEKEAAILLMALSYGLVNG